MPFFTSFSGKILSAPGLKLGVRSTIVRFITAGSGLFTLPEDFSSLISIEAIGGGGGVSGASQATTGGGGGGYSLSSSVTGLVAGGSIYYSVGSGGGLNTGGGDSWVNVVSNAPPTDSAYGVLAKGAETPTVQGAGG